jgi:REP element-mobilizing transposase RayT
MCPLFRNKYLIESTRLKGFDYSAPGKYFITICTKNKIPFFGKICNGEMILSESGIIAHNSWLAIPSHFPSALLDEFIIMPDHIHGIIIIESGVQTPKLGVSTTPKLGVST